MIVCVFMMAGLFFLTIEVQSWLDNRKSNLKDLEDYEKAYIERL